ncbi:peptidoglycan D,D-transpeptidase FtsI family protein [Rhizobium sp.]
MISYLVRLKSRTHFIIRSDRGSTIDSFKGVRYGQQKTAKSRIVIVIVAICVAYAAIMIRMAQLGVSAPVTTASIVAQPRKIASRPDILDRNGVLLATDINTVSLFAEPNKVLDPDEIVEGLAQVLPDLDREAIYRRLVSKSSFQWLRRQLTPREQSRILEMGLPGIGFRPEKLRFYPAGEMTSHLVGHVNVDNFGLAGMERYLDRQGLADLRELGMNRADMLVPVKLSIDLRVQNIVHDVVTRAMTDYKAQAAGAVILDVETGEVLAMVSVPDYDPNQPSRNLPDGTVDKEYEKGWFNRMSNATFEMGSTFKSFTLAMGIEDGKIGLDTVIDASKPIRIGGFTIRDFKGKYRPLTVREVFQYSSNIATATVADMVGIDFHKAFLTRLGLLTRMTTELPEVATPTQPSVWKKVNATTISYGHGVSTTPLQTAVAGAALINGGELIPPTFLPRTREETLPLITQVIKTDTSAKMRELFRWNGFKGSGRSAQVEGFDVGGKTGTADKVVNGRYGVGLNFNAFLGAFPMEKPRYIVLAVIDAPLTGENGGRTAASTAAPMVKAIVSRSAALLGVKPSFDGSALLANF